MLCAYFLLNESLNPTVAEYKSKENREAKALAEEPEQQNPEK